MRDITDLVWLEAGRHPGVLLQRAARVVVGVRVSLVDVTGGRGLPRPLPRPRQLQLHLARHPRHVRLGLSES